MDNFSLSQGNVFLERSQGDKTIHLSDAVLEKNTAVGIGSCIADGVVINNSVVGRNCKIGNHSKLNHCYLFDNVIIEDNCVLSHCILDEGVIMRSGSVAKRGCVFGKGVIVGWGSVISGLHARKPINQEANDPLFGKSSSVFVCKKVVHVDESDQWGQDGRPDLVEESEGSPTESDAEDNDYGDEEDYVKSFYSEVMDNFKRGITENVSCDNLILEVNSMKHAYNIQINEVNTLMIQALIEVADSAAEGTTLAAKTLSLVKFLLPLIKNYVRDETSQSDCLLALEEYYLCNKETFNASLLVKVIKFLYDNDILEEEVICEWFRDASGELSCLIHKLKEEEVDEEKVNCQRLSLRKERLVKQFIQWLEEADEESSEDED
jgi:translation initiation factor eIF-2B subunit epsilon